MRAMLNICGHLSNQWFSFFNHGLHGWAQIVFGNLRALDRSEAFDDKQPTLFLNIDHRIIKHLTQCMRC